MRCSLKNRRRLKLRKGVKMIKIGSKVVCINNTGIKPVNNIQLTHMGVYHVDGVRELSKGIGVSLSEKPEYIPVMQENGNIVRMRQYFNINRFIDLTEITNEQTTTISHTL
jgi:hypothetical protein